jgi:hypothetical protein
MAEAPASNRGMRLGRIPSGSTPHLPSLRRYTARAPLPSPPASVDWGQGTEFWPLLANDHLGDCTVAAMLHFTQAAERWHDGIGRAATDSDAIAAYESLGYAPARPETDTGARIADLLQHWRTPGYTRLGTPDSINAFARVELSDLHQALWLFGPLIVGAQLPLAARNADWTAPATLEGPAAPGSWGCHCMLLTAWHKDGSVDLITWGGVKRAEPGWLNAYLDEAWAVLHPIWTATGRSPAGWLQQQLTTDMANL